MKRLLAGAVLFLVPVATAGSHDVFDRTFEKPAECGENHVKVTFPAKVIIGADQRLTFARHEEKRQLHTVEIDPADGVFRFDFCERWDEDRERCVHRTYAFSFDPKIVWKWVVDDEGWAKTTKIDCSRNPGNCVSLAREINAWGELDPRGDQKGIPVLWTFMNSKDKNPELWNALVCSVELLKAFRDATVK
ncbi:MAG: hypothetical protein V1495_05935 [Pseudomonadota bacterium]